MVKRAIAKKPHPPSDPADQYYSGEDEEENMALPTGTEAQSSRATAPSPNFEIPPSRTELLLMELINLHKEQRKVEPTSPPTLHTPEYAVPASIPNRREFGGIVIPLPKLQSQNQLESHIRDVEGIFRESGWMPSRGTLHEDVNFRASVLIKDSLTPVKSVRKFYDAQVRAGLNWATIRKSLIKLFCDADTMRQDLETELKAISCTKPYQEFICSIRNLYFSHQNLYEDDKYELKNFVNLVCAKLPREALREVIREVTIYPGIDWQTKLPFYSSHEHDVTFLSTLESVLNTTGIVESFKYTRPVDKVHQVNGTPNQAQPKTGPWLEPWVSQFKEVYKCWGPLHYDELKELQAKCQPPAVEVRFIPSIKGRPPYGLLGLNSPKPELKCEHKVFTLKSKN